MSPRTKLAILTPNTKEQLMENLVLHLVFFLHGFVSRETESEDGLEKTPTVCTHRRLVDDVHQSSQESRGPSRLSRGH